MRERRPGATPAFSIVLWFASAMTGGVGLAIAYGLGEFERYRHEAAVPTVLTIALAFFVLSRLWMLVPIAPVAPRIVRFWADFILIISAGVWYAVDPSQYSVILSLGAVYSLLTGLGSSGRAGWTALIEGWPSPGAGRAARRLLVGALLAVLAGGALLALPISQQGAYPISWEELQARQALHTMAYHCANCLFTATGALTGTGMPVQDIGSQYTRFGQIVILVLMQIGGFAVVVIGSAVGWRFRQWIGWGAPGDEPSPSQVRRLLWFVCILALVIEAAGARAMYKTWDFAPNVNILDPVDKAAHDRAFASVFHAVSAFCNVGLTLEPNSLMAHRDDMAVYAVILPLMVIGSIGGPAMFDLLRRLFRWRHQRPRRLGKDTLITLAATPLLIVAGAGLLYGIESTTQLQLRNTRDSTPGSLHLPESQAASASAGDAVGESDRARAERLRSMSAGARAAAAVVHSITARGGGMWTTRLDEESVSPASRLVIALWMLIGGALGGTTGGLRIAVVVLLITSLRFRALDPAQPWASAREVARQRGMAMAAAVATALLGLITLLTVILVYRGAASVESSVFEVVSACCNVGFAARLPAQLATGDKYLVGQIGLIVGMVLGRVIPFMILFRCMSPSATAASRPDAA